MATAKVKALYDRRAGFYRTVMHRLRRDVTAEHLRNALPPTLPPGARVLDVGCGSGLLAPMLLRSYPTATILGCDYAAKLLAIHHQEFPTMQLIEGDFNHPETFRWFVDQRPVQLEAESFDLIVSAGALSEYGDLTSVLPVCRTWLKPGGTLVNIGIERNGWGYVVGLLWRFLPRGSHSFRAACRQAGFTRAEIVPSGKSSFGKHWSEFVVRAIN